MRPSGSEALHEPDGALVRPVEVMLRPVGALLVRTRGPKLRPVGSSAAHGGPPVTLGVLLRSARVLVGHRCPTASAALVEPVGVLLRPTGALLWTAGPLMWNVGLFSGPRGALFGSRSPSAA